MALSPDDFTVHQNLEKISALVRKLTDERKPGQAYSLGVLTATAEVDHVILDDEVLEQIANSSDLNDATGYYAIWLMKRTEANGGVFKRDF